MGRGDAPHLLIMYTIREQSLDHFMDVAQRLHAKLAASPFWYLMKDDPGIMEFINAVREIESQCKSQTAPPQEVPSNTNAPIIGKSCVVSGPEVSGSSNVPSRDVKP